MRIRLTAGAVFVLLAVAAPNARGQVSSTDPRLAFGGASGETVVRTLNMRLEQNVASVAFIRHDLLDETGRAIPASAITLDPPRLENVSPGIVQVKVSVTLPARSGTYSGTLDIVADDSPAHPVEVEVKVKVDATPVITVSPANLVIRLSGAWWDLPFAGAPTAEEAFFGPRAEGHGRFDLQQAANSNATIESVSVVGLRKASGVTLPVGTVSIDDVDTIPRRDARSVEVTVVGRNLEAGEYTGTITIAVKDQSTLLQLPFTLKVKDGRPLALIILVGGVLVALAFNYWSGRGHAYVDAARTIERLARGIKGEDSEQALPAAERDEAMRLLSLAANAIDGGQTPEKVGGLVIAAETKIEEVRTKIKDLLDKLDSLDKEIGDRIGTKLVEIYRERARISRANIKGGRFSTLVDATSNVSKLTGEMERWKKLQADFENLSAENQGTRRGPVDAAVTLKDYDAAIRGVSPALPPSGDGVDGDQIAEPSVDIATLPRLRLLEKIIWGVTLLFVLALGWITLYMAADTFGADPKDYLSLFLWGTVTSSVFGKAVGFGDLKKLAFPGA